MKLCSIIVVTHNHLDLTKQCLDSIIKITDYAPTEIIVVDSHSSDGTVEYLRSRTEIKLVCLDMNYPYSYSVNRGIEAAKGEYLCLINNDTIFVQPEWLKKLIQCAENDPRIGIVGPKLCKKDLSPSLVDAGRNIFPDTTDGTGFAVKPSNNNVTLVTYVVGACFLLKRELIRKIGFFDEKFFFAFDETDYCLRAWKAGFRVVYCTSSYVVHLGSQTFKIVTKNDYEYDVNKYEDSAKRFYTKHSSKDFEMVLKEIKGPLNFCLWYINYKVFKTLAKNSVVDGALHSFLRRFIAEDLDLNISKLKK